MTKAFRAACLAMIITLCVPVNAGATSRIKDLANVEGVRQNQLIGYGLVVGLNGTGDTLNNIPFTKQSLTAMLERLGVNIRGQTIRTVAASGGIATPAAVAARVMDARPASTSARATTAARSDAYTTARTCRTRAGPSRSTRLPAIGAPTPTATVSPATPTPAAP